MNINVMHYPNCTWTLEGVSFFCAHDEIEVVEYVEDHMGIETRIEGYACAECGEPLDGSPAEDRADAIAEQQLMELLNK